PTPAWEASAEGALPALGVSRAQAVADCQELLRLMTARQPTPASRATLAAMHHRYLGAAKPAKGESMSLAYRLRLFSLDRWNLWGRLTRYRTWMGPDGETLDGTNNACERAIGWGGKGRSRAVGAHKGTPR